MKKNKSRFSKQVLTAAMKCFTVDFSDPTISIIIDTNDCNYLKNRIIEALKTNDLLLAAKLMVICLAFVVEQTQFVDAKKNILMQELDKAGKELAAQKTTIVPSLTDPSTAQIIVDTLNAIGTPTVSGEQVMGIKIKDFKDNFES